jgi:hypothetical protein
MVRNNSKAGGRNSGGNPERHTKTLFDRIPWGNSTGEKKKLERTVRGLVTIEPTAATLV